MHNYKPKKMSRIKTEKKEGNNEKIMMQRQINYAKNKQMQGI